MENNTQTNVVIDNSDDGSDLTDNFEEFHVNSFLRRFAVPGIKYLSKEEADRRTVESFSDEFKNAMQDVRTEMVYIFNLS